MGLACAHELLKSGHRVTVYEAAPRIGGMAVSFDFDGTEIERYCHFICRPDQSLFDLLEELGMAESLVWVPTRMGFYYQGTMFEWGRPDRLLAFPHLGMVSKLRYAANVMYSKSMPNWRALDKLEATAWLKGWIGEEAYDVLWRPLLDLKFHGFAGNLSAAWIANRVHRVARSRKNLFQEELGHLEGGSETLIRRLADQGF